MRNIDILLLLIIISTSRGQLNYEGNPLTENTDYTAEESHYSRRNDPRLSRQFNKSNVKVIDSYVAAANSLINDVETKKSTIKSSSFNVTPTNGKSTYTNNNVDVNHTNNIRSMTYEVPSITLQHSKSIGQMHQPNIHTSNQRHDITNEIQIALSRQIDSLPSSNQALNYFLKSQTPEESQLALENYLRIHNNNADGIGKLKGYELDNEQNYISLAQDINQQLPSDNLYEQSTGGKNLITNSYPIDHNIYQSHPLLSSSSVDITQQIPIQNRRDFIPTNPRQRRPLHHYYRQVGGPHRSRQRPQTRIGHGHYSSVHPPSLFIGDGGGGVGKSSSDIIYTRPPGIHRPQSSSGVISNPHAQYEDASGHFPDSNYPPMSKDVYLSQLYSQSYDPYYYNYIAKTGKIKPWLYGKLGPKEDSGFWNELLQGFKNHGMKNILNPMFLLGLSIPAVTLMLSAMVNKRSFNGRSMKEYRSSDWNWNERDLDKLHANLLATIKCMNEKNVNDNDISKCIEHK